ncbi:acetyltransferase [Bacillus sp. AFS017336]|uniref:acetyltransferase n=1 Tax=Bacillus sp. AFS017336 TaxID=2033489 RepID=UPI000BEFB694|nr:acetyltransferase [Bacillus sp. AFS017336]PEL07034.1 acetyltransferase [Bacillus sp. AFS017336]
MNIIILGNGGHSRVVQDILSTNNVYKITAILDGKYKDEKHEKGIFYGPFASIKNYLDKDVKFIIAIGDNKIRKSIVSTFDIKKEQFLTIIHPTAVVSHSSKIGYGTVVMPNAVINAQACIGDHCIINTGAIIEHDNQIGNYTHISPNATLTGNVFIEEGVHIGASATIIPGVKVGRWSIVGAGSTVIRHIPSFSTVVGCPAKIIKNLNSIE